MLAEAAARIGGDSSLVELDARVNIYRIRFTSGDSPAERMTSTNS